MMITVVESVIILLTVLVLIITPASMFLTPRGANLGYGPTGLYLQLRICCESYSATAIQLNFDLLLPGVKPGSASNPYQPPTGKAESTLLYGLQL